MMSLVKANFVTGCSQHLTACITGIPRATRASGPSRMSRRRKGFRGTALSRRGTLVRGTGRSRHGVGWDAVPVKAQRPDEAREVYEGRDSGGTFVCGRRHPGAWRRLQTRATAAGRRARPGSRTNPDDSAFPATTTAQPNPTGVPGRAFTTTPTSIVGHRGACSPRRKRSVLGDHFLYRIMADIPLESARADSRRGRPGHAGDSASPATTLSTGSWPAQPGRRLTSATAARTTHHCQASVCDMRH